MNATKLPRMMLHPLFLLVGVPHGPLDVGVPLSPREVEQKRVRVEKELVVRSRHGGRDVPRCINAPELDETRVVLDRVSHKLGRLRLTLRLDDDAHLGDEDQTCR